MGNSNRFKIKKDNLILFIYAISAAYFANNGGLSTALLSNSFIHILMQTVFLGIPLISFCLKKRKAQKKDLHIYLFCILMFATTLYHSGWSIFSTIRFASILLFCIYVCRSKQLAKYTINILLASYYIYAFFTFFEFFDRGFYLSHIMPLFEDTAGVLRNAFSLGYMAGITGHTSSNGMFLCCAMLIIATRYLAKKNKIDIIILLVFFAALLLTGKRGHVIFIVIALYGIFYFSLTGQKASKKLPKIIGVVIIAVGLAFIVIRNIPSLTVVVSRVQNALEGDDTSVQIRFMLWNLAINSFKSHPLTGIGWHQFYSTLSYSIGSNRGFETHNVYLQLLCETGIIGFGIYISWMVYILFSALKTYKKIVILSATDNEDKWIMGFATAFQLFFFMYCFTGNPLYDWKMNIPYYMTCGIVLYYKNQIETRTKPFVHEEIKERG